MLALYRSGRQTEALEAYRHARQVLVEELGIEPSPALRELEKAILAQDPALEPPPPRLPEERGGPSAKQTQTRHRRQLVFAIGVAIVAVGAIGAALRTRSDATVDVRPNSVAVIDPGSNKLVHDIDVGREPAFVAAAGKHAWVGNRRDRNLKRIDPDRSWTPINIPLDAPPSALFADQNAAWVVTAGSRLELARFDPRFEDATKKIGIGAELSTSKAGCAIWGSALGCPLVLGNGSIWTLGGLDGSLTRRNPTSLRELQRGRVQLPDFATAIAAGTDAIWVTTKSSGVLRIDPDTNSVVNPPFAIAAVPVDVAVGANAVWVASEGDDQVIRLDPTARWHQDTVNVGDRPTAIAVNFGSVWVACKGDGTVWRIDPATNKVVKRWKLPASPEDIAAGAGAVWIAVYSKLRS